MLKAVLFDWGDTLMRFDYDEALIGVGHAAGFTALDRDPPPAADAFTRNFRERFLQLFVPAAVDEIDYASLVRECLGDVDVDVTDAELDRFLVAEHDAWKPARHLPGTTLSLLDALRDLGLRVGLVSNAFDPPALLHRDLAETRVAERLDVAVFSSEGGKRKPHPAIFERALGELDVAAAATLFVGDRLYEDVRGAGELGMTTVQALWFRADENADGWEPNFQAFTQFDVLNVAHRLMDGS